MRPNRVFFPQALLDTWIADERVELNGNELLLRDEGRKYRIVEAVHVIADAAGRGDTRKLIGKVKSKDQLEGAEILEDSVVIGDDAYDVIPGFAGEPVGAFDARAKDSVRPPSPAANDEDLLAQFLIKSL